MSCCVSSGVSSSYSSRRATWPCTRIAGREPTLTWRSEAPRATICSRRSSIELVRMPVSPSDELSAVDPDSLNTSVAGRKGLRAAPSASLHPGQDSPVEATPLPVAVAKRAPWLPRRSVNAINDSAAADSERERLHAHRASRCHHHSRHPARDGSAVVPLIQRRANNSAAKANVRAAIPAVEAYNADDSTGYSGLDSDRHEVPYDQGVKNVDLLGTSKRGLVLPGQLRSGTRVLVQGRSPG